MADQRNKGGVDLESLSPSLVIPDYFSCSQSSTIVIIYDEPVGSVQDQVRFIFPGEVQGSPLKKVVPQRVDKRTFILETPVYNISNRGFLYVTPQVRLASGELKEMSDIKISLKHPVRSVMELCLKLSTQNAVLPVLLALVIHSKEAEGQEQDTEDYKLLQDAHFDRIMATLVGSIEPGTKYLREVFLPSRKWKKCSLEEFARTFQMHEMEKQAYMLRQRAKEKKRGKQNNKDRSNYAQSEDDLDDPFYSIGHSHLSTSTPDIFRDTEEESRSSSMGRGRHPVSANINVKTKTLPQPPSKTMSFQEDVSWNLNAMTKKPAYEEDNDTNVYDPIDFDDDFVDSSKISKKRKNIMRKPIVPSPGTLTSPLHKQKLPDIPNRRGDDVTSLDSYEDMNREMKVGANEDEIEDSRWRQAQSPWSNQRTAKPLPPPPSADPRARPQLPLPPPSCDPLSPSHQYSVSLKKKNKNSGIESRPLPEPPKQSSPIKRRPILEPKPAQLKQRRQKKRGIGVAQSFRQKDIYVPDSASSDDDNDDDERVPFTPGKGPLGIPKTSSENDIASVDKDHFYEAPEIPEEVKKRTKKFLFTKDVPEAPTSRGGATNGSGSTQQQSQHEQAEYQNLPVLKEIEPEPEVVPPPLPHRNHPAPTFSPPPPLPPPLVDYDEASASPNAPPEAAVPPSPQPRPLKKSLPVPPLKHKSHTAPRPQVELSAIAGHKLVSRMRSNPAGPGSTNHEQHRQMSELSAALMNRSLAGATPTTPKSKPRKPVGGMRYI